MKIALTGGIACGKSLVARFLNELGVLTLDADDIVHELVPTEERKRLAAIVFNDPAELKRLEARLHPLVKARLRDWLSAPSPSVCGEAGLRVAIIPLLFEVQWDAEFDIICCVSSDRETQIARMMTTRGYSRTEAEARMAAQMPVAAKAAKSHYVINNDGSADELRAQVVRFADWLQRKQVGAGR